MPLSVSQRRFDALREQLLTLTYVHASLMLMQACNWQAYRRIGKNQCISLISDTHLLL